MVLFHSLINLEGTQVQTNQSEAMIWLAVRVTFLKMLKTKTYLWIFRFLTSCFASERIQIKKKQQPDGELMELLAAAAAAETHRFIFPQTCMFADGWRSRWFRELRRGPDSHWAGMSKFCACLFTPKYHSPSAPSPSLLPCGPLSSALLNEHVWKAETWGGKEDEGSRILTRSAAAGSCFFFVGNLKFK